MDAKWFIILFLIITDVYASTETLDVTTTKKYCGTILADVLSLACKGRYNTLVDAYRSKRSARAGYPFASKKNSISLLRHRRTKRNIGVYNECCVKGCSYTEMRAYCASK